MIRRCKHRHPARGLAAATLALAGCQAQAGDGAWVDRAELNVARQEVGAARIGNSVFVVGGLLDGFSATTSVEVYDIEHNTWTTLAAPLPAPRDHLGVAALNGLLYVIGGYAGNFSARDTVFIYDPGSGQWSDGPSLPASRGACWAVAHDGRILVFGGTNSNGAAVRTTFILDPASGWSSGADMPTAREHLTAAAVGAMGHPDVLMAAAVGMPHPKWQERPLLVIQAKPHTTPTADSIREFLAERVPKWWLPEGIEFIDQMPIGPTGKILKTKLREIYKDYKFPDEG